MQTAIVWLTIGLFIGANVGIIAAALCWSAKDADEPRGAERHKADQQQDHRKVVIVHH